MIIRAIKFFFIYCAFAALFSAKASIDSTKIVYLFCGHSNAKFFFDYKGADEFIETMEAMYCDYEFSTIRCVQLANRLDLMRYGKSKYDDFLTDIIAVKDSMIIGGLFLWFGFADALYEKDSKCVSENFNRIIADVKIICNNTTLPIFVNRYDINANDKYQTKYYKAVQRQISEIKGVYFFPIKDMPNCRYRPKDHHYDSLGHWILGRELCSIIKLYNLDFWYSEKKVR